MSSGAFRLGHVYATVRNDRTYGVRIVDIFNDRATFRYVFEPADSGKNTGQAPNVPIDACMEADGPGWYDWFFVDILR